MVESARTRLCDFGKGERRLLQEHPDLRYSRQSKIIGALHAKRVYFAQERSIGILKEAGTMLDRRGGLEYKELVGGGPGGMFCPGNAQIPPPPKLFFQPMREIFPKRGEKREGA